MSLINSDNLDEANKTNRRSKITHRGEEINIEEEKNKTDKKVREMCSTAGAVLLPQKRRDES